MEYLQRLAQEKMGKAEAVEELKNLMVDRKPLNENAFGVINAWLPDGYFAHVPHRTEMQRFSTGDFVGMSVWQMINEVASATQCDVFVYGRVLVLEYSPKKPSVNYRP